MCVCVYMYEIKINSYVRASNTYIIIIVVVVYY